MKKYAKPNKICFNDSDNLDFVGSINLHDELIIHLTQLKPKKQFITMNFGSVDTYRQFEESDSYEYLSSYHWCEEGSRLGLFRVKESEFIDWVKYNSTQGEVMNGFHHYLLVTLNYIFDIMAFDEPKTKISDKLPALISTGN